MCKGVVLPEGCGMVSLPENAGSQRAPALTLSDGEQIPSGSASEIHRVQLKRLTAFVFMI